jgi:hypothetical protein
MKNRLFARRGAPDLLTEELISAFAGQASFEFKALFTVVYANLRARNAAHGGEEMLRLRIYEKLQHLVQVGGVNKREKVYSGNPDILETLTEQVAARHCRELLAVVNSPVSQS